MPATTDLLRDYFIFNDGTPRDNLPQDYIAYLRTLTRFKHGELDGLPPFAVILHDAKVDEHLVRLGFFEDDYNELRTGTTDPNLLYVVRKPGFGCDFMLNRGMPGAGGIATQAAELCALGARWIVHIGTCGLLSTRLPEGLPILAEAAYADGAAVMLSDPTEGRVERLAHPDPELGALLLAELANAKVASGIGYTIPIFYLQPPGLIRALVDGSAFPEGPHAGYCEMEQASLFKMCNLMGAHAASLVVGSDRYLIDPQGKLNHQFFDVDSDNVKSQAFAATLAAFRKIAQAHPNP
jgi:uridine phosphorylase